MNKTVIAHFDSIDMATIAAKNVTSRIKGIKDVKVAYKSADSATKNKLFSNFFLPPSFTNGIILNNTMPYHVDLNAIREKKQDQENEQFANGARVEITTANETVSNIESCLRCFGGLDIKVK